MSRNTSWKTLSSEILFKNPWTVFKHNTFEMPDGKKGNYYFVSTNGSSIIVPILPDGRVILTKQYRYLTNRQSIEFPAGGVQTNRSHEDAAMSELREETGYETKKLEYVGEFCPFNGVTDEICKVFIARDLSFVGQKLEDTEQGTEVLMLDDRDIARMIENNEIQDGQTLAAWTMCKAKLKKDQ